MKTKIKEVHDYFRNKLIKGEFESDKIDEHHINLMIDNKYLFVIWIANEAYGIKTERRIYVYPVTGVMEYMYSFMNLTFRESDKKTLWSKLKPIIKKYNDTILLAEKKRTFERLKRELNK